MAQKKATPDSSKKHYAVQLKEELVEKERRIAELEAALANADPILTPTPAAGGVAGARTATDAAINTGARDTTAAVVPDYRDDVDWIDENVSAVWFVTKRMAINLRAANSRVMPPIEGIMLNAAGAGPWAANPFDMRSNDLNVDSRAAKEKLNAAMYANWGYFCLTRQLAEDVFGDERMPLPKKAVVDAREFKGWDAQTQRAVGIYRPLTNPDPLREVMRKLLQELDACFIDASHHGTKIGVGRGKLDARNPNPYRPRLGNLAQKLPPVVQEGETP